MTDYIVQICKAITTHAEQAEASHIEVEVRGVGYVDLDRPLGVWKVGGITRNKQRPGASFWRYYLAHQTGKGWWIEEFIDQQARENAIGVLKRVAANHASEEARKQAAFAAWDARAKNLPSRR